MLDNGTNPLDPYVNPQSHTAAIIVVQNVYLFEREPQLDSK